MENLMVATFQNQENADAGLQKLHDLDRINDIVIYNMVMIQKTGEKHFDVLYHQGPDTADLPAKGAIMGSLVGLIAGPIGMALGMLTGAIVGSVDEGDTDEFSSEFLDKVSKQLQPGNYAIVADVEEYSEFMVDSYLGACQGLVVRTPMQDVLDAYDEYQEDKLDQEIMDEEKALKTAGEKDRAAIQTKLNDLKAKREERNKKMKANLDRSRQHFHEKVKSLDQMIAAAEGKQIDNLKTYKDKIEAKMKRWNEQVSSALS